jgi:sarcosine oxidase subunit alpha
MRTPQNRGGFGGHIDRSQVVNFTFEGKAYCGLQGDTLASALLANNVMLTARSFRYHRPRGIFSAGCEECHALVSVGENAECETNVRATQQLLFEGLSARSQNAWPTLKWDMGALTGWLSRFLPAGFYYKTFIRPRWKWYAGTVRRLAAVAPAPQGADANRYDKQHAHCDLLIIGAGPAGLAAARAAAEAAASSGLRIILADDQPQVGGSLLWCHEQVDGQEASQWAARTYAHLAKLDHVSVLLQTTVVAAWDQGYFTAEQKLSNSTQAHRARRLWKIRARRVILASGAIERPLVFPNNDRPGVMLADSARQYIIRYAVRPGRSAVIFTNNDSAYDAAFCLHGVGARVNGIVDLRATPPADLVQMANVLGIPVFAGYAVMDTRGYWRIKRARIRPLQMEAHSGLTERWLDCDLLCISGGWNPALHLWSQDGGRLVYHETNACFVPQGGPLSNHSSIQPVGSARGSFTLPQCLEEGHQAGLETVRSLTDVTSPLVPVPTAPPSRAASAIMPHWMTHVPGQGRQWVDQLHDVTAADIHIALQEGFVSVEHLKRYTTIGMAIDQGKTANVNALGITAEATGQTINATGTTTFRPPYVPVMLGSLAGRETGVRAWPMRRLPLHDWHLEAGAGMEDHSGWYRPAFYLRTGETEAQSIRREALAARSGVVLLDSSSLGKIEVCGPDATRFLNRMYINNVEALEPGRVRYGMMLTENGIIFDDGIFARLTENFFIVSTSSAGLAKVMMAFEEWLQTEWPDLEVLVCNVTGQWATLTVSGPQSRTVMERFLPGVGLSAARLPHMSVLTGETPDFPWRLMRVSFTGELSFEINVPANQALSAWTRLLEYGRELGITPLGMEALDLLRIEKGYLEVGVDTDVSTNPLDTGWGNAIARKAADFVGKRSLSRPHDMNPRRQQLVGLKPIEQSRLLPAGSHIIRQVSGRPEGHVTSSCISPSLGCSIALAMLEGGHDREGETVMVDIDAQRFQARVVGMNFYDPANERIHQ